jgi:hypothetical protein
MTAVKRFSQVLDHGFLYNDQSAWFDKSTLATPRQTKVNRQTVEP